MKLHGLTCASPEASSFAEASGDRSARRAPVVSSSFALIAFGLRTDEHQIFFVLLAHRSSDVNQSIVGPWYLLLLRRNVKRSSHV